MDVNDYARHQTARVVHASIASNRASTGFSYMGTAYPHQGPIA